MLNEYGKKEMKAPNTQQDKAVRENKDVKIEVEIEVTKKDEQASNEASQPQHNDN